MAALVRSLTCSLRKILAKCILTVGSLMKRHLLISRLFVPVATSRGTLFCCVVAFGLQRKFEQQYGSQPNHSASQAYPI